jgi:hypothetical protein
MLSSDIYLQGGSGKNGPNMGKNNGKMGKNGNTNGQTPENRVKNLFFFKLITRNQNFSYSVLFFSRMEVEVEEMVVKMM